MKEFTGILEKFPKPHLYIYHIKVPVDIANAFYENNARRVVCSINDNDGFQTGIIPDGGDVYFLKMNKELRDKYKLQVGDKVRITLEKDESEFGFELPLEFEEIMSQDPDAGSYFLNLTPGKQRTLIHMIAKIKNDNLRLEKSVIIFTHLKNNVGKLDFRQLNDEFREARKR